MSTFAREHVKRSLTSSAFLLFLLSSIVAPANGQFTVNLSSVTPNVAARMNTVQLSFSGFVGAVNPATVTVTLTPTGVGAVVGPFAPNSSQILPGGELVVTFSVPATTGTGTYVPSVTGQNTSLLNFTSTNSGGLTLTVNAPTLISVTPASGQQGQTLQVTIIGNLSNFVQGSTTADFGAGISVGGAPVGGPGPVTVQNPTTALATLVISAGAALTTRNVVVTTGTESITLTNGFTVTPGPFTVALTSVTPSTTSPSSLVQLTASGFSGAVNPATVTVTLTPTVGSPVGPIAASASQVLPGGELAVTFVVPAGTTLAVYRPSIAGQNTLGASFTSTNPSNLTLTVVAASLASIVPATAQQGQTLQVTINGTLTHFAQGSTVANFGAGISVNGGPEGGSGVLTVQTPTTAVSHAGHLWHCHSGRPCGDGDDGH